MTVPIAGRGPQVNAVYGMFLALSTVAIALRCYCRVFVVKSFGVDDYSAVIAWIFFVLFCAFAITGVYHGTGQHADVLPPQEIPVGLKWWWACEPVYVLSNMSLKFSIGIFLLRIAVDRLHRIIIYIAVIAVEIYGAFYFFLFVLQCHPSAYFWTRYTGGKGTCIDPGITVDATYGYSAVSCAVDWTLGILPIFIIWRLQMNPRMKIVVGMILGVGAIASTATIIRFPYVKNLANQADFLYATTDVAIWSCSETGIGITACSVATLRPLFRTFFGGSSNAAGDSTAEARAVPPPWPKKPERQNNGYMRSTGDEEIGLRTDIGKSVDVTTVVRSGSKSAASKGSKSTGISAYDNFAREHSDRSAGWEGNGSDSKLNEISSDEEEFHARETRGGERSQEGWGKGIREGAIQTRSSS